MKNNLWLKTMPPVFQNSGIEYFSAKKILETEQDNEGRERKRKEVEDFWQSMAPCEAIPEVSNYTGVNWVEIS